MDEMKPAAKKAYAAKAERRKRLSALPIAEKVRILVRMQKMAAPLLKAQGREVRVWEVDSNED